MIAYGDCDLGVGCFAFTLVVWVCILLHVWGSSSCCLVLLVGAFVMH